MPGMAVGATTVTAEDPEPIQVDEAWRGEHALGVPNAKVRVR